MSKTALSSAKLSFRDDLTLHLRSGYPVIFIITSEEHRALTELEFAAAAAGRELICPRQRGTVMPLFDALRAEGDSSGILVLDDLHRRFHDPDVIRLLSDAGSEGPLKSRTIVILTPVPHIPEELERLSAMLELPLPDATDLQEILSGICVECGVLLMADDARAMVRVGQGLTADEARRAFRKGLLGWPESALDACASVEQDKRRALRRSNVLEHNDVQLDLDDVGGMDQLKKWLNSRRSAFSDEARAFGLPAPRGLLLMGIQGCGKSLLAKCVAGYWRLPLVRLDLSAVYGQESPEASLRGALKVAEAMAPVVLWIDEIEKGFDNTSKGEASRLLGGLITWLQEKNKEVFVVATANRVESLPPELPRKGRFDEIFFVDLPDPHERKAIWELHLRKRGFNPGDFDLETMIHRSDKMTGSEIEQLVIAAMYLAFGHGSNLTDNDLIRARADTVSLYETFEADIKKLREWARKRARSATSDKRKVDYFSE